MGLVNDLFQKRENIRNLIRQKGMEEAVKKYSLKHLVKQGFLVRLGSTDMYHDDGFGFENSVYNKKGKLLGKVTTLMGSFYKELGGFEEPCLNGNIILSCSEHKNKEWKSRTYGVFNKKGKQIVPYGKYFAHEFLPNGVALINGYGKEDINVTTVTYAGDVTEEDYFSIDEIFYIAKSAETRSYQINKKVGNEVVTDFIDMSQEVEKTNS